MGSRVSTLSPYRGRCIEVFEALRHADRQLHQRELFLWRDAKLFFIDESTASQQSSCGCRSSQHHSFFSVQSCLTLHAALQLLVQHLCSLLGRFHPLLHLKHANAVKFLACVTLRSFNNHCTLSRLTITRSACRSSVASCVLQMCNEHTAQY